MKAKILDSRSEGASECFLCRITLEDYVASLPSTYQDYDVQREIVSNVYLDRLIETVLARKHIPPIVLVVEAGNHSKTDDELLIATFKILDGLQRKKKQVEQVGSGLRFFDGTNRRIEGLTPIPDRKIEGLTRRVFRRAMS